MIDVPTDHSSAFTPPSIAPDPTTADTELARRIQSLAEHDKEYWAFKANTTERRMQRLFQYPAMTVPELQRDLLRAVRDVAPVGHVYDPFLGAGTTLAEAMGQGFNFEGQDINPLAVLVARVKTGPFHDNLFRDAVLQVAARARATAVNSTHPAIQKITRWYAAHVAEDLARLHETVRQVSDAETRRFLWVALAEAARRTSYASPTSFKLHRRVRNGTERMCAITMFEDLGMRNAATLSERRKHLERDGFLCSGRYSGRVCIRLGDTREQYYSRHALADVLLTSPPYGDNHSTVAYGQYSYLPLHWIDGSDIDKDWDPELLRTTQEIDRRSLGGRPRTVAVDDFSARSRSPALSGVLERLRHAPPDRAQRVAVFFRDLDDALDPILTRLAPNAYMFWTLGNRTVGGEEVLMDQIMGELLVERGCYPVTSFVRSIPIKRLASRNAMSQTMRTETILVLRGPARSSRAILPTMCANASVAGHPGASPLPNALRLSLADPAPT